MEAILKKPTYLDGERMSKNEQLVFVQQRGTINLLQHLMNLGSNDVSVVDVLKVGDTGIPRKVVVVLPGNGMAEDPNMS